MFKDAKHIKNIVNLHKITSIFCCLFFLHRFYKNKKKPPTFQKSQRKKSKNYEKGKKISHLTIFGTVCLLLHRYQVCD